MELILFLLLIWVGVIWRSPSRNNRERHKRVGFTIRPWTKDEREAYKDSTRHYNRYDVGEYMDDLVDDWHTVGGINVSLYDFLGLLEEEVYAWVSSGIIPKRIIELWEKGEY